MYWLSQIKTKKRRFKLFIDESYGSGIQHIAFESYNIFAAVEILRKSGVKFTPLILIIKI